MSPIVNPVLPGFNPDPSICRVGEDYYIATSTFEWYPGVQIHHSRDLVHWHLVARPLTRASQLDMRGEADSAGVWAPCLTHADGLFWLIYTDMQRSEGDFKDSHNYLVTAPSIEGPWSEPTFLNASGFDPSLFHDEDGRKYLLNQIWDFRRSPTAFAGIALQELDPRTRRLIGEPANIFAGTAIGRSEGPHLYRMRGWYWLVLAEGGTGYEHVVSIVRARVLTGPWEVHPDNPVLGSQGDPSAVLQRAGHGSLVETPQGELYMAHLCSRPLPGVRRSVLGRETAIQKLVWGEDGWPRLAHGGCVPAVEVPAPTGHAPCPWPAEPPLEPFDAPELPTPFQWLRTPHPDRLFSLTARPGWLRLFGRGSVGNWHEQALIARRQTAFAVRAETTLEVAPRGFQQMAGLIAYYNRTRFHYLAVTAAEGGGRTLALISCNGTWPESALTFPPTGEVFLPASGPIRLGLDIAGAVLQFRYRIGGSAWQPVGPALDASVLSDEGSRGVHGSFTGNFIGMAAQDLSGAGLVADFDDFLYLPAGA